MDNINADAKRRSNRDCRTKCGGNSDQFCGGKGTVNLYDLRNSAGVQEVMVIYGGVDARGNILQDAVVINNDGTECKGHELEETNLKNYGMTTIGDRYVLICGGILGK